MPSALWSGRSATAHGAAPDLGRALARELGLDRAPDVGVLPADTTASPAGSLLPPRERYSGMPAPTHAYLYVDATRPRPFELRAALLSGRTLRGRSIGLGALLYAVPLRAKVATQVALTGGGPMGPQRFGGDPKAAARLNADPELARQAAAVSVTRAGPDTRHTWEVDRLLVVEPYPGGAVLLARTLHRATTPQWEVRAPALLDLAARIETLLVG
ncbi:hypothetical protein DN069_27100 [Streptacidiphilus pinicola]|uniref:Uncharacterized protein n=1 Tax=Streptacidiphilus pinicola TaxID=2219663 RepID=A0A2X0IGH9_9ACTN|nr:hypothetical protein [Streptacidiphilus pinicola]RAG82521.1 hypothetical protein DN069_27100 [Streptacidiphilus pinicola]